MSFNNEKAVNQQPIQTPGMMVSPGGGGNRNSKNLPMEADGRDWSNGFFDCFGDAGTCVMAWCCPCIVYGQNKQRYESLQTKGVVDPEHGGFCNGDAITHAALTICCGAGWILQMGNRSNIRARYQIKGTTVTDCLSAACCTPCELVQEARELELEEQSLGVGKA